MEYSILKNILHTINDLGLEENFEEQDLINLKMLVKDRSQECEMNLNRNIENEYEDITYNIIRVQDKPHANLDDTIEFIRTLDLESLKMLYLAKYLKERFIDEKTSKLNIQNLELGINAGRILSKGINHIKFDSAIDNAAEEYVSNFLNPYYEDCDCTWDEILTTLSDKLNYT